MKKKTNRFDKARALVTIGAVKTLREDKSGRVIDAFVTGSKAKIYNVIIRRQGRNYIETECLLQVGIGVEDCKGGWNSVCYHAVAVLLTSAESHGFEVAICQTEQRATRRKNLNGKVYKVQSRHAPDNPLWLVLAKDDSDTLELTKPTKPTKPKRSADEVIKELRY